MPASDDLLRVCFTHEVGMQHLDPDRLPFACANCGEESAIVKRLQAQLAERDAEIALLREALLSDCQTVEGDRDHPCWCYAGALNHLQDCWQRRAALAARGGAS